MGDITLLTRSIIILPYFINIAMHFILICIISNACDKKGKLSTILARKDYLLIIRKVVWYYNNYSLIKDHILKIRKIVRHLTSYKNNMFITFIILQLQLWFDQDIVWRFLSLSAIAYIFRIMMYSIWLECQY